MASFNPGQLNWAALSGLASGNNVGEQFANVNNIIASQQPGVEAKATENKTLAYLNQFHPEIAAQVTAGMPMQNALQMVAQAQKPKTPDFGFMNIDGRLIRTDKTSGDFQELGNYSDPSDNSVKRGLNPVWGVDANGKRALGTLGEDGSFLPVELPPGFEPTPGTSTVDLGTSIGIRDNKSGNILQTLPKDIAGVEQQKVAGKTLGDNKAQLPTTLAKADQTIKDIDDALTHPGLESATGWQSVFPTMAGSNSADFEAKLDKLKGGAFLEAFQSLKGGGQITEVEGKKATDAIAVLSTSQSDVALRQALRDLREVISAGKARALNSANVAQPNSKVESLVEKYRTK